MEERDNPQRVVDLMRADPTLRLLSDEDIQEAIRFWDAMFDDRKQVLTVEETGAVRHILSILNGELAERKARSSAVAAIRPHAPRDNNWITRLFR